MRHAAIDILRCPDDRGPLELIGPVTANDGGGIEAGRLRCAACGRLFDVEGGIPSLLPRRLDAEKDSDADACDAAADMHREMEARDDESEQYDILYDDASYRFEIETYVTQLAAQPGEAILDVGCGTGRVTKEYLAGAGSVVGADFSRGSLELFRRRVDPALAGKLSLVHCAVGRLPFADASFDAVVATSLFSNVPTAPTREAGLMEVDRVLKPGGRFLVTVYNHCLLKRLRRRLGLSRSGRKEGHHSGGRIHYYNFDPAEFGRWVSGRFAAGPCFGLNHRIPVLSNLSPGIAEAIDRLMFHTPFTLRVCANEMGMVAQKGGHTDPPQSPSC